MDRTTRLLDLLRGRGRVRLAELAAHLGVSERTVRRDLARLAGVDVELDVQPGRAGGVRLVRDSHLPALRFTEDEALVLAVALGAAASDPRLAGPAESARRRLGRVLSGKYGDQLEAFMDVSRERHDLLGVDRLDGGVLLTLALAGARHLRVEVDHVSTGGRITRRQIDPYAVLPMAGHWYLTGYCHLRGAVRTFRIDRLRRVEVTAIPVVVPDGFDATETVARGIRESGAATLVCEFLVAGTERDARAIAPSYRMEVQPAPRAGRVRCRIRADESRLAQIARILLDAGLPITVIGPDGLREALRDLAARAEAMADG